MPPSPVSGVVDDARPIRTAEASAGHPPLTAGFAWTHAVLGALFVGGVYVDLWAHNNVRPLFDTFFTPWHGLLYGAYAVMAAYLGAASGANRAAGRPWTMTLPEGYGLSLVGVAVFAAAGAFDLAWHTIFGIEANLDAALSPAHLALLLGAALMVSAPLRAAAAGNNPWTWTAVLAALGTLLLVLPFLTFFEGPFATRTGTGALGRLEETRVLATLTYAAALAGTFLFLLRTGELPLGAGLVIVGGSGAVMALVRTLSLASARDLFIVVALVAGLLADGLLRVLRPAAGRPASLRLFAAALPVAILTPYLAAIVVALPVTWTAHAIAGSVVLPAAVGWLVGVLATPPPPGSYPRRD